MSNPGVSTRFLSTAARNPYQTFWAVNKKEAATRGKKLNLETSRPEKTDEKNYSQKQNSDFLTVPKTFNKRHQKTKFSHTKFTLKKKIDFFFQLESSLWGQTSLLGSILTMMDCLIQIH